MGKTKQQQNTRAMISQRLGVNEYTPPFHFIVYRGTENRLRWKESEREHSSAYCNDCHNTLHVKSNRYIMHRRSRSDFIYAVTALAKAIGKIIV